MYALAKSMTLLPRSPAVIKWVNDWRKLLMVGWATWPLRSCQVSISENQKFYQSSKNVTALCWILPPRKLLNQQDVSFLSLLSFLCSCCLLSTPVPGIYQSLLRLSLGFVHTEGRNLRNGFRRRGGKVILTIGFSTDGSVIQRGCRLTSLEPQIAHLWDEKTCS